MELDDTQHYAVAALFTEYLHATSLATGIAGDEDSVGPTAWGEPESRQTFDPAGGDAERDVASFWGRDCIAPGQGLCERVYKHLGVPQVLYCCLS